MKNAIQCLKVRLAWQREKNLMKLKLYEAIWLALAALLSEGRWRVLIWLFEFLDSIYRLQKYRTTIASNNIGQRSSSHTGHSLPSGCQIDSLQSLIVTHYPPMTLPEQLSMPAGKANNLQRLAGAFSITESSLEFSRLRWISSINRMPHSPFASPSLCQSVRKRPAILIKQRN